ncbi:cupredoxin domain-containing protein [Lactococcus fujiensis]|uniref:Copper-binding protein n=1 Tax=Lactococcus fujiensis JCM 16395 TaxID=1291764 RepID=A0A2A5RKU8_9LACT|nr:cupredoxin domain-containing protein [Lactococcus fujiensis]PCR99846.1 copper-binding protein [Lactococcus fujiensis JCM 16395]
MDKIIILIIALLFIAFVIWWFFGKHTSSESTSVLTSNGQEALVTVNGGYNPNTLVLKKGVPAQVTFLRKDPSTCLEEVIFPDFGIHEKLPQNKPIDLDIDTDKAGEYTYNCGMNMFHGKIIIK